MFSRAYSGKLDAGSYVLTLELERKNVFLEFSKCTANKQNQYRSYEAGDIGALVGFKDIKTGDTLCEKNTNCFESMDFPDPVIGVAIEPKTQADVDKMGMA